jgi:protein-tyrosine phosphatase
MIDLHTHVLPGIDDGARDLGEATAMCRLAAEDGCEVMVATPHQRHYRWWNGSTEELAARLAELQEAVGETPKLFVGAEINVDPEIVDDLQHQPPREATSLAGSRYLLLEARRNNGSIELEETLHELRVAGWRPVLAHPELIAGLGDDLERLERLRQAGVYFQLTAMSVTGEFGRSAREIATAILDRGLAHFVASDAHGTSHRPPGLGAARELIAHQWGDEVARRLTVDNPRAVIEDRPLDEAAP